MKLVCDDVLWWCIAMILCDDVLWWYFVIMFGDKICSLRSRGAHWDRKLAVEVQGWLLGYDAGGWGPGMAERIGEKLGDEDWRGSWRRELARRRKRRRRRRRRTAVIKSNNPHLRGGEQCLLFELIVELVHNICETKGNTRCCLYRLTVAV